jgi:hypothetical protein
LEKFYEVISDALVKIFTSQMGITGSCEHFEYTIINSKQGDIKGTTTEIEYDNVLLSCFFIKTVSNSGS